MLSVNNIFCGYNGIDAVKGLSFTLHENEKICIIGPNGCGKTTVLRALCGLLDYRGEIKLNGREISNLKRKNISKTIAFMPQISSSFFSYTVFETVSFGRYLVSQKKIFADASKEDDEIVLNYLEKVGLADLKDKLITELSGGQLQRVYLARVFAQEPKIILLDEPTNYLDLKHQIELIDYIKEWGKADGHAVVGVLHDINLALRFADKILIMDSGEIKAMGTPKEIATSKIIDDVYKMDIKDYMKSSLELWK